MSNLCIKEREEKNKTRGLKGAWKGTYFDPKKASKKPPRASSGLLAGPIGNLKGPHRRLNSRDTVFLCESRIWQI
jgi:hypothetical protein